MKSHCKRSCRVCGWWKALQSCRPWAISFQKTEFAIDEINRINLLSRQSFVYKQICHVVKPCTWLVHYLGIMRFQERARFFFFWNWRKTGTIRRAQCMSEKILALNSTLWIDLNCNPTDPNLASGPSLSRLLWLMFARLPQTFQGSLCSVFQKGHVIIAEILLSWCLVYHSGIV